jgi:hypothetical protein
LRARRQFGSSLAHLSLSNRKLFGDFAPLVNARSKQIPAGGTEAKTPARKGAFNDSPDEGWLMSVAQRGTGKI